MLKSCKYCGKIHDSKIDCGFKPKPKKIKRTTHKDKFRNTMDWQNKRNEIRNRDNNLCQVCIRKLYNTIDQFTYVGLSVHHAVPLEEDYHRRLDNDNLLTVCDMHHEMAENGVIPREIIVNIIKKQEEKYEESY